MKTLLLTTALIASATAATAQSTIHGLNLRLGEAYSSNTAGFVAGYIQGAPTTDNLFGLDYDASATTIWGLNYDTAGYGTYDPVTNVYIEQGLTALTPQGITGLAAHPNGTTWYATNYNGADSELWTGDVTTGTFTMTGIIATGIIIDIAVSAGGDVYATSISDNSLYSVDAGTGVGTLLGALGPIINFAQGMDFDWSNDTLYATLYTGGGVGEFVTLDLTTGAVLTTEATTSLNAEMMMTIEVPSGGGGPGTPFCDPNENNSTGVPTNMTAAFGSGSGSDLTLNSNDGPPSQFGYFLVGTAVNDPGIMIPMSNGRLCLLLGGGNSLGRYNVGGSQFNSLGRFDAAGDLINQVGTSASGAGYDVPTTVPIAGSPQITSGSTWHFQLWHREAAGQSNFSNGLSVTFP